MTLRIHNTLTGRVEVFRPIEAGRVSFYTCGPTVYDYAHIGNFRSFLAADVLRRWLESPLCGRVDPSGKPDESRGEGGYRVTQVMNITDVGHMVDDSGADGGGDDKMEAARKRLLEGKKSGKLPQGVGNEFDPDDPSAIADYYAAAFVEDARALGLRVVRDAEDDPSLMPRPTREIRGMLEMILSLIDNGHAYVGSDGVVYFDTLSSPDYGRLSGNTLDKIRSGAGGRVDEATQGIKKHPADFMLWKPDPRHLMRWDPALVLADDAGLAAKAKRLGLREGYPGWHIECSVMAAARLGTEIDLHSGGEDNIFPHHECEIAQSRCAFGTEFFARYWFHARFLFVEGAKMSKSKGNFFTVRDLMGKGFAPDAIRLELIKTHYRSNANFTEQGLRDSARMIARWREFVKKAEGGGDGGDGGARDAAAHAFAGAMNDDLNIAGAIGVVNTWINSTPAPTRGDARVMARFDGVLGVLNRESFVASSGSDAGGDAEIDALVRARDEARKAKNWAESDRIRDELAARGIEIKDAPGGATWERKASL
ncbi:MAG: cysteine--tRNA ligase [Phycisphaerales bacterium]